MAPINRKSTPLPDISELTSFANLFAAERNKILKLQSANVSLQKKYDQMKKKYDLLQNRFDSKPLKRLQRNIGVQVKLNVTSIGTEQYNCEKAVASTQTQIHAVSFGIQTMDELTDNIDSFTQTDSQTIADASTQTTSRAETKSAESVSTSNHCVANKTKVQTNDKILKCDFCPYTTKHSGHFAVHKSEGCWNANVEKDMNCAICCQSYTYNNLRAHLRQYLKDSSKAVNGHQNYTPDDHNKLLEKIKKEKKEAKG